VIRPSYHNLQGFSTTFVGSTPGLLPIGPHALAGLVGDFVVQVVREAYGGRLAFSARRQGGLVARVTVPVREVSGEPSPLDDDSLATGDNAVRDNRDEKAS